MDEIRDYTHLIDHQYDGCDVWQKVSAELRASQSDSSYIAESNLPKFGVMPGWRCESRDFLFVRQPFFSQYEAAILNSSKQVFGLTGKGYGNSAFLHYFATKYCFDCRYLVVYVPRLCEKFRFRCHLKVKLAQAFYHGCRVANLQNYKQLTKLDDLTTLLRKCIDFAKENGKALLVIIDEIEVQLSTIDAICNSTQFDPHVKVILSSASNSHPSSQVGGKRVQQEVDQVQSVRKFDFQKLKDIIEKIVPCTRSEYKDRSLAELHSMGRHLLLELGQTEGDKVESVRKLDHQELQDIVRILVPHELPPHASAKNVAQRLSICRHLLWELGQIKISPFPFGNAVHYLPHLPKITSAEAEILASKLNEFVAVQRSRSKWEKLSTIDFAGLPFLAALQWSTWAVKQRSKEQQLLAAICLTEDLLKNRDDALHYSWFKKLEEESLEKVYSLRWVVYREHGYPLREEAE